jgi:hypothetical protein
MRTNLSNLPYYHQIVDNDTVDHHSIEKRSKHRASTQNASVRLRHAPFRRENIFDERTVVLTPRSRKLLFDVFELAVHRRLIARRLTPKTVCLRQAERSCLILHLR